MIICVVGPTGVGKTELSIRLAKKYNGIVINADSCQVYKELNIGTAKIRDDEMLGVKHYLLNIKSPKEDYSVCDFQKDLRDIIDNNKDKNIVIVGGTGLYITAGLYDYNFSEFKDIDLDSYTNEELLKMCKKIDEEVDIHVNNRRRLENYIKRTDHSVKKLKLLYKDVYFIGLTTDREELYARINKRVDKMIYNGLVEEVDCLYKKYGKTKILSSAIGYKEIIEYLDNKKTLSEAIEDIKKNSRHYAKRQYTWFNNKMDITWFKTNYENINYTLEEVVEFIENKKELNN